MKVCYKFATGRVQAREIASMGGIAPAAVVVRIHEPTGHAEAELLVTGDYYNGARVYREVIR